jgi:hypothetical protein
MEIRWNDQERNEEVLQRDDEEKLTYEGSEMDW